MDTMCVTLDKQSDGTIRMKGTTYKKGNYVWTVDRNVNAKDLFDEMLKIADHANNNLKLGCVFEVE